MKTKQLPRKDRLLIGMVAVVLIILPFIIPVMKLHLLAEILIFSLFAISYNLLAGSCGLSPFGHAAFFGVGGYATALILNYSTKTPIAVVLSVAVASGLIASLIIGFFCVRTKATYFALLSLAFQMFLYAVALQWRTVTKGDDGMGVMRPELYFPGLGNISLVDIHNLYYIILIGVGLGIAVCYFLLKTPLGNAAVCIRENDQRAAFLGYNVFLTNWIVFSISGSVAALAGALFVIFQEFVATSIIDTNMSFTVVVMTIIGGTGKFVGPVLGVLFYVLFQNWLSSLTTYWWFFLGLTFILVVLYLKEGLVGLFDLEWIRRIVAGGEKS